jgi:hypothetical protein
MFADSPGLHGIEHPIFDIWLTECKGGTTVIHEAPQVQASTPNPDESPPTDVSQDANSPERPAEQTKKKKSKPPPTIVAAPAPVTVAPLDPPPTQSAPGNARAR